ncbi:sensor histidine kinase [Candidatus Magnetomonas plexicatena]|uniref:sensor histidine kinase n=1 Tax=Candidatus Magnetomonas plexicatena TaxID=2552947 RepID=UPI001C767944|nr:GHKL domain-containing protein [Nitrospirales bacterium LBB_01]
MLKKPGGYLKNLPVFEHFSHSGASGAARYKRMKISITLLMTVISTFFLLIVIVTGRMWLKNVLKEETKSQLSWQLESTKLSMEYFLNVKLSALNFIASEYSYKQLLNEDTLNNCFMNFKKNFGDVMVDLGVIDSFGIMRSYAGPYKLKDYDYSEQDWFYNINVREFYISDVFKGYRKIPHFALAVKKTFPGRNNFWVLRATIDMEKLVQLLSYVSLTENDDVFIINTKGVLQTPSRSHGKELTLYTGKIPFNQHGVILQTDEEPPSSNGILGYTYIKNSPWILIAHVKSKEDTRISKSFLNELLIVFVLCLMIIVAVTLRMAHVMVNWIKDADQKRDIAFLEIEQSSKLASIGRLSAGVAHEINNPMSIISQNAGLMKDMLEMSFDSVDKEQLQTFSGNIRMKEKFITLTNGIMDAVNRCRTITHRLLGFARHLDVSNEPADLNDTVDEVVSFLEKEILFRDIHLVRNFDETLPHILTDKGQLQQVLLNIINNAVDAVSRGGAIELSTGFRDKETVYVSIKDNGPGIPSGQKQHIFEPFFTTKERGKGTGLGLFISYGIMEKIGGKIHVESEEGKWTEFFIELPVKTVDYT